jgi:enoyl-CoA hydratase/carnithine racemase
LIKLMSYRSIIYEKKEFIASITLNSPDSGNAISTRLSQELAGLCASINSDEEIRVITITGAGKHFCLGTELAEQKTEPHSVAKTILHIDRPVIAAINGDALGQGLELALACDLRIAADTSRFGLPQIASGSIPWDGGTQLLPRIVGRTKAMEIILLGEAIDATLACEIGLVNKVVPLRELMPTVMEMATKLSSGATLSLRYAKEAVCQGLDLTLDQGLHLEADLYHLLQTTEDRIEGIAAFQQRRTPKFKGK